LIKLQDQEAVAFLRGRNTVRDGRLVALSVHDDEGFEPTVRLEFHVPRGTEGSRYTLELRGALEFDYGFSSDYAFSQIAMVKVLWADESKFYISLDPWKESEDFISEQDNDCFRANSVKLTVERA